MKTRVFKSKPWLDCPVSGPLLRPREVFGRTGLSKSQVYAMIAEGTFPPFLKVSTRASAMPESWLESYIEERARIAISEAE